MTVPTTRENPFDPPAELSATPPLSRLRFADGTLGWLVTDHATARFVLSDDRFSARMDLIRSPIRTSEPVQIPGAFLFMDPPEHTRYRRLLTAQFTLRRMRALEPRIAEIAARLLDELAQPADLVRGFALPLPSLVICELLGVPYEAHERFERASHTMVDPTLPLPERDAAGEEMFGLLAEVVAAKHHTPGDDLLSGLLDQPELSAEEVLGIGVMLLFAGHETTANMLGLGAFALLRHPDQLALLRANPDLIDGAVEELLRHLSIVQYEVNRAALADVEVAGQLIAKGDPVLVSIPVANRDPSRFPDPATLDITRNTSGHLAFGHGVHQCLGQQLARTELRIGFSALLSRFPELRLAVPPEDVPLRTGRGIYGVDALPVTW